MHLLPTFVEFIHVLFLLLWYSQKEETSRGLVCIGQYSVLGVISLLSHVNEVRGRAMRSSCSGAGIPNRFSVAESPQNAPV